MMSMISVFQTAVRVTDADMVAKILLCGILMIVFLSLKGEEERGVTGIFQYLIAGIFCIFTKNSNWNNRNAQLQVENEVVNPKKENKKKKEAPPPVLDEKKKKNSKKAKRFSKKMNAKENQEPMEMKPKKSKTYEKFGVYNLLNMSKEQIYFNLYKLILTEEQLRRNNYPATGYQPPNQVPQGCDTRLCARCGTQFEVYNGKTYLSNSYCFYHPKKPLYNGTSPIRVHPCCGRTVGDEGCTKNSYHVTVQHAARPLVASATRRHIKKDLQHSVFSLDCEMSYTTGGLEITRICMVNVDGETVYDSYVKPKCQILDYNTEFSGVEKHHLDNITITLDDVRGILNTMIHKDTILVGHALNNDLTALGFIHNTIVDTSVLYPNLRIPGHKRSLKSLVMEYLGSTIQDNPHGHDCVEDARSSLRLALLQIPPNPPSMIRESEQEEDIEEYPVASYCESHTVSSVPLMETQNWLPPILQDRRSFPYPSYCFQYPPRATRIGYNF